MRGWRVMAAVGVMLAGGPAWGEGPVQVPVALFVKGPVRGYGSYAAREGNRFKSGDTLAFYTEPSGFTYGADGAEWRIGLLMDLRLKRGDEVLYEKERFATLSLVSHHQNREIDIDGTLEVSGILAGEYVLELVTRDTVGGTAATTLLPFVIE